MRRNIKYLLILIISISFINVKAVSKCSTDEMNNLKELASNMEFKTSYDYFTDENGIELVKYTLKVSNMNDNLKILYRENSSYEFRQVSVSELENYTFMDGLKLEFKIYSYTANLCTNELLRTVKIDLPKYNYYYSINKEKCSKYPEFKYCKEFMNIDNIDVTTIDKLFSEYINENGTIVDKIDNNKTLYIIIGSVLVVGLGVGIYFVFSKRKRNV